MKKAFAQLHLAIFLAGFTAILGKLIVLNEAVLVTYRIAFTLLLLLVLMGISKQFVTISHREKLKIAAVGCIIAFHWVCFYASVKYATVSVGLVCLSATGFFTALLQPLIQQKKIVWAEVFLGILAVAGIYIIFDFHRQYYLGIGFGILAALGSALFPIFNKTMLIKHTPRMVSFYEMIGGLAVLLLSLPLYLHFFPQGGLVPGWMDIVYLLILAGLCTVYCFDLQLNALKLLSPFTTNLSYNLEPVYGIILSFLFFKEGQLLNQGFYIGLGIIMLAVCLQMLREWQISRKKTVV